ncbi:hypothetical protein BBP00_00001715 [Phytophthora kernoviae]|uniref:Histone-lysine N-methyltransferase n=1 Tax=Phytophthora kernoviae TaxID=325452 RepID=A0A3F2RZH8_9STRA|nr:hypothetical protein BBP00_00001715 [Phytophthora kernoviae]
MANADDLMQELCGVSLAAIDNTQDVAHELLEQHLLDVERAVLESDTQRVRSAREDLQPTSDVVSAVFTMAELICEGEYADVVRLPHAQTLLKTVVELRAEEKDNEDEDTHVCGSIATALQSFLLDHCDDAESRLVAAYEFLFVGIAFFNMYVQANYTGPAFERETLRDVLDLATQVVAGAADAVSNDKKTHSDALVALQVDGESPFSICEYPQFLLLGRCFLDYVGNQAYNDWSVAADVLADGQNDNEVSDDVVQGPAKRPVTGGAAVRALGEMLEQIKSAVWWNARAVVAHERLLLAKQPSNTLWFEARRGYIQTMRTTELFTAEKETQYLLARAYVEWGLAQHHFDKNKHGKRTFARAKEISGVSVQLSGFMGKRTKFQQKAVAQMVLLAASSKEPESTDSVYATAVAETTHVDFGGKQVTVEGESGEESTSSAAPPAAGLTAEEEQIQKMVQEGEASYRNVNLDQVDQDNILLESIAFEDRKLTQQGNLQIVDQIVLLGLCLDVKNSNADDGLTREEMMPYVARVLENPNNWMVYSTALLERAWIECESSKRRERAVLQMQALVDQHTTRLTITQNTLASIADSAPARERMQFVYSLAFPPRYALTRDLAERYFKLGVLGSAVEICENLEMWDDVVKCYQLLDKPMRAEKLVRERLEIAPTPFMWVTLGDLTQEPAHYETSWALSKQRFARAKRSLGRHYFEQGDPETAIPHYKEAVRVGPMHTGAWFTLGALSMRVHSWDLAMRAFTRVVQLEPDNGEAWGNLGSIHLNNQRFAEAFAVLQEALKQKRHMWQMWENYALCAMETKRYGEAMYAMHQLLDMRTKHKRPVDSEMLAWLVEAIVYPESLKKMQQEVDAEAGATENAATDSEDEDEAGQVEEDDEDLVGLDETVVATDATPPRSDSNLKKQLAMLFGRATSIVTNDAKVWQVYAHFNDGVEGRSDKARDCRLKQCRALQVAGWEREQAKVEALCIAATRLTQDYLEEGTKKALYSCRLYIRGVLKKVQVDFAEYEAVKTLASALDEIREPVHEPEIPSEVATKPSLIEPETTRFLQLLEDDARHLPPPPPPLTKRRGPGNAVTGQRVVDFELPFKVAEMKTLEERQWVRRPLPFGKINRCVYVSTTMPIADLPVHKCTCFEEIHKSTTKRTTQMASAKAKKEAENSGEQRLENKQTTVYCGEGCYNRMLFISCSDETCSAPDPSMCSNRAIKRRELKSVHVKYIPGPGFGLIAKEEIRAGEFIIEYVGEVIDDEECERRMIKYRDNGEINFYMMELEKNIVIDAKYRSNESRFINHSCDPNSVTQKWNVDGMQRIGIFARRNIAPGEEITIDYNFSHFGEAVECKCGSTACTGKIGLKRSKLPTFNPRVAITAKTKKMETVDELPPELKRPWNKRIPSSSSIDPERINRFIDHVKDGQIFINTNLNDLNEDTLAMVPRDDTPWFCSECTNPKHLQKGSEESATGVAASRGTRSSSRVSECTQAGRQLRTHSALQAPSLKQIFHASKSKEQVKRRHYKKRQRAMDRSYRMLEHMPLPVWTESDASDGEGESEVAVEQ